MRKEKKKQMLVTALGIAVLPPLWAVAAPYAGVKTGAAALICAGVYAANGNKREDGLKIMAGFWCGDLWAVLALKTMMLLNWNENLELFFILAVFGALAVILASLLERFLFLPAWLCGWAIGLSLMTPESLSTDKTLPIQIGAAMAVGVWYVGAGVEWFTALLIGRKRDGKNKEFNDHSNHS